MDDRPRRIRVRTSAPAGLGGDLLQAGLVLGARVDGDGGLLSTPRTRGGSRRALAPLARARGATVLEVRPSTSDLEGVFRYLVER